MEIIEPKDWMSTVLDTSTIQNEVKSEAAEIRTRRIRKARELEASSAKIAQEMQSIKSLLEKAQDALSKLNVSNQNKDALNRLIIDLENAYSLYESSTRNLAKRFQNAKIRIIAFGSKGQGKSSFIKAFTNLPNEIVTPKEEGSTKDKTGTTCIYFHKPGVSVENPEIYVVFRKPEEILSKVNEALSMLSKAGLSINEKNYFSSLSELQDVLDNEKNRLAIYNKIEKLTQKKDSTVPDFLSYKNILKNFFYPHSDYSEIIDNSNKDYFVKEKGKLISLSELPMYNDMQYEGTRRFSIVSEIHVYVDLGRDNMFENIEICDTKGISVEAGGRVWEKELYSELENCDAAFSIQFDADPSTGKGSKGFYQKISDEMVNHPAQFNDFDLKHYIVINSHTGGILSEVVENAKEIAQLNIAQSLYIGALISNARIKFGKKESKILDMQKFVDFVIYNMMKKIVVNTNETDKNLETALDENKMAVHVKKTEILKLLRDINGELPKDKLDWDNDVIIPALLDKKRKVEDNILKYARQKNITLPTAKDKESEQTTSYTNSTSNGWNADEDEGQTQTSTNYENSSSDEDISTSEYVPEDDEISEGIYKMITREELKTETPVGNQKAVELAIGKLYDDCIKKAGKKGGFLKYEIICTAKCIGSFIDNLSLLIFEKVNQNINHYFIANSNNDNLTDFKTNVFNILWTEFSVNQFCECQKFDVELLKTMIKSGGQKYLMLERWIETYEKVTSENKATCIYPRTSYAILKAFFDSVPQLPSEDELRSNTRPVFKDNELRKAVITAYSFHDYATRYKEQINNDTRNKQNVLTSLVSDMDVEYKYVLELLDLYKSLKPNEYGKILMDCGFISPENKAVFDNQESIKTFVSIVEQITTLKSSL